MLAQGVKPAFSFSGGRRFHFLDPMHALSANGRETDAA
jgi:hypothetical protein